MSVLSPLSREISAKIVYYGPGLSGKTTSLQQIHRAVRPERRGELVSLATETDRTIFFDFLPVRVERVRGMAVRFQLYTVPGQVFYAATRKVVLNGADGVVFVADSQPSSRDANLESLDGLRSNLADHGIDLETFPLVFQYNKQDLVSALSEDEMEALLNSFGAPQVCTAAIRGTGVLQALKEVSRLVIRALDKAAPAKDRSSSPHVTMDAKVGAEWFRGAPEADSIAGRVASMARAAPLVDLTTSSARPAAKAAFGLTAGPATQPSARPTARASVAPLSQPSARPEAPAEAQAAAEQLAPPDAQPSAAPVAELVVPPSAELDGEPVSSKAPSRAPRAYSFDELWPDDSRHIVREVEERIAHDDHIGAVLVASQALADLLEALPGPTSDDGPAAKATLLGLDGREYLRLCRLATLPPESIERRHALFALHMLIAARIKTDAL